MHDQEKFAHRDIKPSNIFLIEDNYKLGDFGVSKVYSMENFGQTNTIIGTIPYFSPQLREFFDNIDDNDFSVNKVKSENNEFNDFDYFKNDVFSLGLTILQATTYK